MSDWTYRPKSHPRSDGETSSWIRSDGATVGRRSSSKPWRASLPDGKAVKAEGDFVPAPPPARFNLAATAKGHLDMRFPLRLPDPAEPMGVVALFEGAVRSARVVPVVTGGFAVQFEHSRADGVWHNHVKPDGGVVYLDPDAARTKALQLSRTKPNRTGS